MFVYFESVAWKSGRRKKGKNEKENKSERERGERVRDRYGKSNQGLIEREREIEIGKRARKRKSKIACKMVGQKLRPSHLKRH